VSRRRVGSVSLATLLVLWLSIPIQGLAPAPAPKTYDWVAQFVTADATTKTVTVKAKIPEYVSKYINRFKPGDRVMLVWNMLPPRAEAVAQRPAPAGGRAPTGSGDKPSVEDANPASPGGTPQPPTPPPPVALKTESDVLLAIWSYEPKNDAINTGYVLPGEFVSAETNMVTIKLRVPENALRAAESMQPGQWLQATSPMSQPTEVTAVSALKMKKG
jgi:hypothetical protein